MASVFASHNYDLPIRSAVATCPVVNLKASLDSVFGGGLLGAYYRNMTLSQLRKAHKYMPDLMKYLDPNPKRKFKWSGDELYNATAHSAFEYTKNATANGKWERAPFKGLEINTLEEFWYYNDYSNFIEEVSIPTSVVYSSDDMMLETNDHSQDLARKLRSRPNINIGTINLKEGNHCAFSSGVGWNTYSALLNGLFKKI